MKTTMTHDELIEGVNWFPTRDSVKARGPAIDWSRYQVVPSGVAHQSREAAAQASRLRQQVSKLRQQVVQLTMDAQLAKLDHAIERLERSEAMRP